MVGEDAQSRNRRAWDIFQSVPNPFPKLKKDVSENPM